MTQRIKLLSVIFTTSILVHCADGPTGRHISGMTRPAGQNQTGKALTTNTGRFPVSEGLRNVIAMLKGENPLPVDVETPIDTIDYSSSVDSREACLNSGDIDTDNDGLSDNCSLEHYANTFNGWIVGGRFLDYKSIEKYNSDYNKRIKDISISDIVPLRDIYYDGASRPIRISDRFSAYKSAAFQASQDDDKNLGLVAGDGDEAIPYHHSTPATSIAGLTGFGKDTNSYGQQNGIKMFVYETNIIFPADTNSLQITLGYLSSDRTFMMPYRHGLYYAINNGDSILLDDQYRENNGKSFIGSKFGTIYRDAGCATAHLTIIYVTDESFYSMNEYKLPVVAAFRATDKDPWTTLGQEYLSIQPQGGITCQQSFGANDIHNNKTFFNISTGISRRVPGVVDFNPSLGRVGGSNPNIMLDKTSTSIENIKDAYSKEKLAKMNLQEATDFYRSLQGLEPTALTADDQKWLSTEKSNASDRIKQIAQEKVIYDQLGQADVLSKKLATITDPNSPDFGKTTGEIDKIIAALEKDPTALNADQTQQLADLKTQYAAKKAAATAPVDPKEFTVAADGTATVPLSADDMTKLNGLGFTFKDANGNVIAPNATTKLTPAQLDSILAQAGAELNSGTVDAAKAKTITDLVQNLKKNKSVDQAKVDQFMNEHGSQLKNAGKPPVVADPKSVQFDPTGDVDLTKNDAVTLKGLGFVLRDKDGNQIGDGAIEGGKITDDNLDSILGELKTKIESGTLTPQEATGIQTVLDNLKKSPGVDQDKLKDFTDEFGPKLAEKSVMKWTPEQLEYLKSIDTPFSKVNPGFGQPTLDAWTNGFRGTDAEKKAKDEALLKIEKKLLDPATLANFPTEERVVEAEKLNKTGFINPERYLALRLNLFKLGNLESADFSFKPAQTSVGKDATGKDIMRDVITLEGATIRFKLGSNQIQYASQQLLKRIAKEIQNYKTLTGKSDVYVLLKAFTDPSGSATTNQKLSECRANAVKDFFVGKINIEKCNGRGVIVGEFSVEDVAHIADDQKLNEPSIKVMGLGIDASKGKKVTEAVAEKLRRVEIYLSDKPF